MVSFSPVVSAYRKILTQIYFTETWKTQLRQTELLLETKLTSIKDCTRRVSKKITCVSCAPSMLRNEIPCHAMLVDLHPMNASHLTLKRLVLLRGQCSASM